MHHDIIYFLSEKCFPDEGHVCPLDPSEPSESIFIHRSQIACIGHIWLLAEASRFLYDFKENKQHSS